MKNVLNIKLAILVLVSVFTINVSAQNFTEIGGALKSGNSTQLAKYFDSSVEVTLLNSEAVYSKSQAEMVIKKFFSSNRPSSYKTVHNGNSGGAKYQIGELSTSTGTYRTYVYAKQNGSSYVIQEIRIEKK